MLAVVSPLANIGNASYGIENDNRSVGMVVRPADSEYSPLCVSGHSACSGSGSRSDQCLVTFRYEVELTRPIMPRILTHLFRESFFQQVVSPLVQRLTMPKHSPLEGVPCNTQN